jgi:hypothetical protein
MTDLNPDGPHSPERTQEIANLVAEGTRFLNYATLSEAPGLVAPCDAYELIGSVKIACERLPQLLSQTGAWLGDQDRRRPLGDSYAHIEGHPQDVHEAVGQATGHLSAAVGLAMQLADHLREAHNLTGGLYVKEEPDGD